MKPHPLSEPLPTRRKFCAIAAATAATAFTLPASLSLAAPDETASAQPFALKYILASSLYGKLPIGEVLAEVERTGSAAIDIWPEPHADHREQIEAIGHATFERALARANTTVGIYTCYNPGLFRCEPWMRVAKRFGGRMVIAASGGPAGLTGDDLKQAVRKFVERLNPLVETANALDMTIGVENHGNALIHSADSMRWLAEFAADKPIGVALAPYHLPADAKLVAKLIEELGPKLVHFYAWEHGRGSTTKLPKLLELKQLPGFGELDFIPIVAALKKINYQNWTSIFMHPVPRGIPILPTAELTTDALNHSREYLAYCLAQV